MTAVKITEDMLLSEIFTLVPEARELLRGAGFSRIEELEIEDVICDKLTLRGFFRLMNVDGQRAGEILREIQLIYNKRLEEA